MIFKIILSVNECKHEHQRSVSYCVHSEWVVYYLSADKLTETRSSWTPAFIPFSSAIVPLFYLPPSNNAHLVITQRIFASDHYKP